MSIATYLDSMRAATTAADLDAAIRDAPPHAFHGRVWSRISRVRVEAGRRICAAHPLGDYVPRIEQRRRLTVCGESYRVAFGQNSAGIRYAWADAEMFCRRVLSARGFSGRAIKLVWGWWPTYPHRALAAVEAALAGELPDPTLNRLIPSRSGSAPVNCVVGEDGRAHRPCRCGGTRFTWGAGLDGYLNVIQWRCNQCRRVYVEYVTDERLREICRRPLGERVARMGEVRR